MTKEKKERVDSRVNQLAEEYYQLRTQNGSEDEKKTVYTKICNEIITHYFPDLILKHPKLESDEIWDIMVNLLFEQLMPETDDKGWKPEKGPFVPCFFWIMKRRIKGCYTDKNKESDKPKEDEETNPIEQEKDPTESADADTMVSTILEYFIRLLNDEVKLLIKKSPNKFCYAMRFFTEWLARQIMEPQIKNILSLIPSSADDCVDLPFASSFMNDDVSTISEIKDRNLKMLSAFSGREKDAMTPCGFDLKNIVYVKYVSAITGKAISDSIISNHRKAFHELLTMQSGKIGISNHPIAES